MASVNSESFSFRIVGELEEKVMAREIGGSMSPIWNSMVEAGRTQVSSTPKYGVRRNLVVALNVL